MNKQLEVGKTYTAVDGLKWRCISLDGDVAYMRLDLAKHAPAHTWSLDGNPISLAGDSNRIVFEPKKGKVVLYGYVGANFGRIKFPDDTHRLTIPTLDGEIPEGNVTIKVEKL